ncbi:hypothetical protein ACFYOW_45695 [Nocardia sp. NPDC006982]|uniref:hypothetical protein n=1 Tax=Nocardia sp. NPDC006982 TaxID=3364307 RepID=UPI00369C4E7B
MNDADRANQRYAQLHELYKTHPRVGSEPPPLSTADPTVAGPAQTATSLTAQGISTQMTPDERAVLRNAKLHELYSKLDLPANAAAKTTTGVPAEPLSEGARTGTVIDAARLGSTIRQAQSYTDPSVAGPGGQRPVERGVGPSL